MSAETASPQPDQQPPSLLHPEVDAEQRRAVEGTQLELVTREDVAGPEAQPAPEATDGHRESLAARAALRVGVIAEGISGAAEKTAYNLSERSVSDRINGLASRGQEKVDSTMETGRRWGRKIGAAVSSRVESGKLTMKQIGAEFKGMGRETKVVGSEVKGFLQDKAAAANERIETRRNDRIARRAAERNIRDNMKQGRREARERRKQVDQAYEKNAALDSAEDLAYSMNGRFDRKEDRAKLRRDVKDKVGYAIEDGKEKVRTGSKEAVRIGKAALKTSGYVAVGTALVAGEAGAKLARKTAEATERKYQEGKVYARDTVNLNRAGYHLWQEERHQEKSGRHGRKLQSK